MDLVLLIRPRTMRTIWIYGRCSASSGFQYKKQLRLFKMLFSKDFLFHRAYSLKCFQNPEENSEQKLETSSMCPASSTKLIPNFLAPNFWLLRQKVKIKWSDKFFQIYLRWKFLRWRHCFGNTKSKLKNRNMEYCNLTATKYWISNVNFEALEATLMVAQKGPYG